ncbi:MAG: hypothetical protein ACP5SH_24085 [Syntrophobacteraceae bacterium]
MIVLKKSYGDYNASDQFIDSLEKLFRETHFTASEIYEMVGHALVHCEFGKDFKWTPEEILKREA